MLLTSKCVTFPRQNVTMTITFSSDRRIGANNNKLVQFLNSLPILHEADTIKKNSMYVYCYYQFMFLAPLLSSVQEYEETRFDTPWTFTIFPQCLQMAATTRVQEAIQQVHSPEWNMSASTSLLTVIWHDLKATQRYQTGSDHTQSHWLYCILCLPPDSSWRDSYTMHKLTDESVRGCPYNYYASLLHLQIDKTVSSKVKANRVCSKQVGLYNSTNNCGCFVVRNPFLIDENLIDECRLDECT